MKQPERKEVVIKQRPQSVSAGLIRANDISPYYLGLANRIEQLAGQLPAAERERFTAEELARVMALSYENRQLVAQALPADLQADLYQIGSFKDDPTFKAGV